MATSANFTVFDCPAIQNVFEDLPDPVTFEETAIIRRVHDSVPRFGYTSDINKLLLGPDDGRSDYAKGLFAASMLIGAGIILWFILLCVFRCLGPKNVGMLSGKLFQPQQPSAARSRNPKKPRNENLDDDKVLLPAAAQVYDSNDTGAPRSPSSQSQTPSVSARQKQILKFTRVMVLLCSLGIVTCSIIMVTKGVQSLVFASDNALRGIEMGQELADEAVVLIDGFIAVADSTTRASRTFVSELNTGFCPAVREELCTNLETAWADVKEVDGVLVDQNGNDVNLQDLPDVECDLAGLPYEEDLEALLNTHTTAIKDQLYGTRADIVEVSETLAIMRENADDFNWAFAVAAAFALILAVLCLIISYGVLEAWFGCSKNRNCLLKLFACLRHWLLLPVFIFLVIMAWLFSMIFIIGSTAASDMCVDSPDDRIEALLYKYGNLAHGDGASGADEVTSDSLIFLFLVFYINGCPAGGSPQGFVEQITEVLTVLDTAVDFVNKVVNDATVTELCGTDPVEFVSSAATTAFEEALCGLGEALVDLQRYFSCENWRPLYRIVVYDAVCYNSNDGFYYVSITQFCIVVFAMIMVTCRVAFTEVEDDEDGATNNNDMNNAAAAMADTRPPPENPNNIAAVEAYDDEPSPRNWTTTPAPQY